MQTSKNSKDILKVVDVIKSMAEAVNASPNGIPSGHLYAHVMGFMSLEMYERIVGLMLEAKAIKKEGHLLLPATSKGTSISTSSSMEDLGL